MIRFTDVNFKYDAKNEFGLKNINLNINTGEFVVISGSSGCGKTSITRLLNGLIPHFYEGELSGEIRIDGICPADLSITQLSQIVGSVFQDPGTQFFTTDTTSEIAFPCENLGYSKDEITSRISTVVEDLQISHLLGKSIFSLSSGEKQSIAIASVYALNPNTFVLDEPSANLDSAATKKLAFILKALREKGCTIIISEHKLYYLRNLIDKLVIMKEGEISKIMGREEYLLLSNKEANKMGLRCVQSEIIPPGSHTTKLKNTMLQMQDVSFQYHKELPLLENITFNLIAGDVVGLVGHNGAGKSTLAELICGLLKETKGQINFDGIPGKPKHRIKKTYYVMQDSDYQLFTESVESELLLGEKHNPKLQKKADYILEYMDLYHLKKQHPASLSGGQKQRLAISVAYMKEADILCFDEPTSGLDFTNMCRIRDLFYDISNQGKTVLVISHDYELLAQTCNKIFWLDGKHNLSQQKLDNHNCNFLFHMFFDTKSSRDCRIS